ncbi:acetyl/propionyl/methylcrotonyl-CoA carboxylase subunit alpha [Thalassomonas actiniarum]|uniref:Biotin carboxylase n=1 Tax=Thalassomonas actiniarum TaxID=485447 RepID=A0AAF0C1V0_9GAMM|nr:biotin carboxylase N-terminal domain-containing protein [Thalassomonas actiniarum]WDD97089.1 ATP-grasp domain-containing protein [Thalassomonas actiniarum]
MSKTLSNSVNKAFSKAFDKILIANRGEIAVRIIKTAKALGYQTVAVFSDADADSPHVSLADCAVHIGAANVSESYLDIEKIIAAAKQTGARAIHPGYGLLSENAGFARACQDNQLIFIGPDAGAIELMGNKQAAKEAMLAADIPCIPGYQGAKQDNNTLKSQAETIGFPLMIKAAAGGGGKGMRLAHSLDDIETLFNSARSEALASFGSEQLILERALVNARHIEIQVVRDLHGNCIHLGERDCSMQRRHQKVIEEAPGVNIGNELRNKMGQAAVNVANSCDYLGVGTVEFLLVQDKQEEAFYFLEMNTRLQVEHPVTEMITGIDLVKWQLDIAHGKALPLTQEQVRFDGHAIEARLYSEDPAQHFMPQSGQISFWQSPEDQDQSQENNIRCDHMLTPRAHISRYYDPMLAKIIVWGEDREQARRRLIQALQQSHLHGIRHNKAFLLELANSEAFANQDSENPVHTRFIDDNLTALKSSSQTQLTPEQWALAATLCYFLQSQSLQGKTLQSETKHQLPRPTQGPGLVLSKHMLLHCDSAPAENKQQSVEITPVSQGEHIGDQALYRVHLAKQAFDIAIVNITANRFTCQINGLRQDYYFSQQQEKLNISGQDFDFGITDLSYHSGQSGSDASGTAQGSGQHFAPMNGTVVAVEKSLGDIIEQGEVLFTIEAMKMELPVKASCSGTLSYINLEKNQQVTSGQLLATISDDEKVEQ